MGKWECRGRGKSDIKRKIMDEILNYYLVNDTLATSGQPTAAQLELIAAMIMRW